MFWAVFSVEKICISGPVFCDLSMAVLTANHLLTDQLIKDTHQFHIFKIAQSTNNIYVNDCWHRISGNSYMSSLPETVYDI